RVVSSSVVTAVTGTGDVKPTSRSMREPVTVTSSITDCCARAGPSASETDKAMPVSARGRTPLAVRPGPKAGHDGTFCLTAWIGDISFPPDLSPPTPSGAPQQPTLPKPVSAVLVLLLPLFCLPRFRPVVKVQPLRRTAARAVSSRTVRRVLLSSMPIRSPVGEGRRRRAAVPASAAFRGEHDEAFHLPAL